MDQQNIFLEGIKIRKSPAIFLVAGLIFFNSYIAHSNDSTSIKKRHFDLILGVKIFATYETPETRVASDIGINAYIFKNEKLSLEYRNFFSAFISVRDASFNKNLLFLNTSNSLSYCYKVVFKKNYIKFGLGPYSLRRQNFGDQYFLLRDPNEFGLEFSMYAKFRWLNVGYRRQIGMFNSTAISGNLFDIFRFGFCIEIPIQLK